MNMRTLVAIPLLCVVGCTGTTHLGETGTEYLHLSHVHRGGGAFESPDNTLKTLLWCWNHGSAAEVDCRITRDGVPILLHDAQLKRTARGISGALASAPVRELLWDAIKDVDVGSYLDAKYADHRIPKIEDCFKAMQGHPKRVLFVDERDLAPERLAKMAEDLGVMKQIYYTTGKYASVRKWSALAKGGQSLLWIGTWPVPKDHSAAEIRRFEDFFENVMEEVRAGGFAGISAVSLHCYYDPGAEEPFVPSAGYLRKLIDEFHAHGIPVCSIPFRGGDAEEVYVKLWEMGCDGFSTDYPSVMFKVIKDLKTGDR